MTIGRVGPSRMTSSGVSSNRPCTCSPTPDATQQFFGTADYDTARYISDALGQHTVSFEARSSSRQIALSLKPGASSRVGHEALPAWIDRLELREILDKEPGLGAVATQQGDAARQVFRAAELAKFIEEERHAVRRLAGRAGDCVQHQADEAAHEAQAGAKPVGLDGEMNRRGSIISGGTLAKRWSLQWPSIRMRGSTSQESPAFRPLGVGIHCFRNGARDRRKQVSRRSRAARCRRSRLSPTAISSNPSRPP